MPEEDSHLPHQTRSQAHIGGPPMLEHLRVSFGTEQEMGRFMTAFKNIFSITTDTGSARA